MAGGTSWTSILLLLCLVVSAGAQDDSEYWLFLLFGWSPPVNLAQPEQGVGLEGGVGVCA